MKLMLKVAASLLTIVGAFTFVGCKASEAKEGGYVDKSRMTNDPSIPFQQSWKKPGFDKSKYTKVYIAPVNTRYMLEHTDWQKGMKKADFEKDVAHLANFTREAVKKAFREDPNHRMQVLDAASRDPGTLNVEIALIEVVPSKVFAFGTGEENVNGSTRYRFET